MTEVEQATQFLTTLFAEKPDKAAIQIWHRTRNSVTHHLAVIEGAANVAVGKPHDVYVGCGLAPKALGKPTRTRLKASEVVGIPGVWADIDVNGGPEGKEGAAPDRDSALELASSLLEPTIIVNSGYGIQAWWCFEDGPWMFPKRQDADNAARIVAGFQGALRAAARRLGWGLDATQDLARVMRIPGSQNFKGAEPVPVTIVANDGYQYSIEDIAELGQGHTLYKAEEVEAADIRLSDSPKPHPVVLELLDNEPEFHGVWNLRTGARGNKRKDWTPSEFEFSICNWLVRAGLNDQEIADTLAYWRLRQDPLDSKNKVRADRLAQTISKVRGTVNIEEERELRSERQELATANLEQAKEKPEPPNEARVLALFNQLIGGPEIARLKQHSRDPEWARFVIELADGREVSLGKFDTLADERSFRKVYAIATGHFPPSIGAKKWDAAVGALLRVAVVSDDKDSSTVGAVTAWVREYFNAAGSTDRDGACQMAAPWLWDHTLGVHAASMTTWLRRAKGERIEQADLIHRLKLSGFERKTINYRLDDDKRTCRSYFIVDADVILADELAEAA